MLTSLIRICQIAAVALAYIAAALPSRFLTPTPLAASPLWLPTGVALTAALLGNWRHMIGVGLGALAVNLWLIGGQAQGPPLPGGDLAVALAAAAILQAIVGRWLVRGLAGFPSELVHGRDIGRFMAVAGPLSSVVSAALTGALLCLFGARAWARFGPDWVIAWAGDTFGVLLVCAVALPLWAEPRDVWRPRVRGVSLPVVGLFLAVLVLFGALRSIEEQRLAVGLNAVCNESATVVRSWFKNAQVGTKDWNDHVAHWPQEPIKPRSAKARGVLGYHDTLSAVGRLVVENGEASIDFWYSRAGTALPPDLNFGTLPHAADTLRRAGTSPDGAAVVLAALGLPVGQPDDLLVIRVAGPPEESRGTARAYSLCVVDMAVVKDKATSYLLRQHIISRWEPGDPPSSDTNPAPGVPSIHWDAGAHVTVPIVLAGQPGTMTYFAGAAYLAVHQSRYLSWLLLLGLAITALIAGQLLLVTGETALVAGEVRRRTAELQSQIAEREKAEQFLRESEERYRLTFDQALLGLVHVDMDGQILRVNPGFCHIVGYSASELIGRNISDITHRDDRATEPHRRAKARSRSQLTLLQRFVRKNGTVVWCDLTPSMVTDPEGRNLFGVNIIQDVTDRRRAEAALKASEAQTWFIQGRPPQEACSVLLDGLLEETDSEYGFLGEITRGAEGPVLSLLAVSPAGKQVAATAIALGDSNTVLGRIFHGDRSVIWSGSTASQEPMGMPAGHPPLRSFLGVPFRSGSEIIGLVGIANRPGGYDEALAEALVPFVTTCSALIGALRTARHEAEMLRALHEGRNRLRALIENTPAAVAMLDRHMRCLACSRRWVTDYRLGERDVIGLPLDEVFRDLPETWKQAHARCLTGAAERCDDDTFPRSDGTHDSVRWLAQPWYDDDGSVGGTIFFTEVITEQKQAEQERRRLEEKLRETQKLESLGVLAGGIAHDFNNLLTGILGYAHLARSCLPEDAEVNPFLVEIEQSSRRAADLCQQMLAYAGKGKFVIGPVDLGQLAQDVTKLLQLSISKKAELTLSLRPQLPAVEADANQMRQVIMNLVMNASDALNDEAGSIRIATSVITVEREQLDAMLLGSERMPGEYVCLEVTDSGCGMDETTKARIFEPFFTTKFTGRGLGLAAVLGIMRGHRGALSLDTVPGCGTTFRLLFPPLAAPLALPAAAAVPAELRGQGTILVADDEEMVRQVTASMTASLGFEIIEVSDGQQAVDELRRNPAAVRAVLLDLTMPRLDGMQAFEAMRHLVPRLPILVMSGYTEMEVKSRFPGEGPAAFLQKPFSRDDLAEKLKEVLT